MGTKNNGKMNAYTKAKDVVVQVDEETAKIMKGISEQLSGDSEAQFEDLLDEMHSEFEALKRATAEQILVIKQDLAQKMGNASGCDDHSLMQLKALQNALAVNKSAVIEYGEKLQTKLDAIQNNIAEKNSAAEGEVKDVIENTGRQIVDQISMQLKAVQDTFLNNKQDAAVVTSEMQEKMNEVQQNIAEQAESIKQELSQAAVSVTRQVADQMPALYDAFADSKQMAAETEEKMLAKLDHIQQNTSEQTDVVKRELSELIENTGKQVTGQMPALYDALVATEQRLNASEERVQTKLDLMHQNSTEQADVIKTEIKEAVVSACGQIADQMPALQDALADSKQAVGEAEGKILVKLDHIQQSAAEQTDAAKQELSQAIECAEEQIIGQISVLQDVLTDNKQAVIASEESLQTKLAEMQSDAVKQADTIAERFKALHNTIAASNQEVAASVAKVHSEVESVKTAMETQAEAILNESDKQAEVIEQVSVSVGEVKAKAEKNFIELLSCLTTLCDSVKEIAVKQDAIIAKQTALEQEVEYLKLPVYKRFFSGGK